MVDEASPEVPTPAVRYVFVANNAVPAFHAQLVAGLAAHGLALSEVQIALLVEHYRLLGEANTRCNLTRLLSPEDAVQRHYLDILTALPCFTGNMPDSWVDVGSGGGFPGIVLAVARPSWRVVLAERRAKKAAFLTDCVGALNLAARVQVYAGEFEPGTAGRVLTQCGVDVSRETFGIVARAVDGGLRSLLRLLRVPLLAHAVLWLGESDAEALAQRLPRGWIIERRHLLPTGRQRVVLALTQRTN